MGVIREMEETEADFLGLLTEELPYSFLAGLWESRDRIYQEAYDKAYADPTWGEPEARYMLPHFRRSVFEAVFRNSGLDAGLIGKALEHGLSLLFG